MMAGETDLNRMLATIEVERRPGSFAFVSNADDLAGAAEAMVREAEGVSVVVSLQAAEDSGRRPGFVGAWLTLSVHSALEAVGLTAAVSRVLADVDIPCNVIAGHHHDHLLVPVDKADEAIAAIEGLKG